MYYYTGSAWNNLAQPSTGNQFIRTGWQYVTATINPANSAESLYVNGVLVAASTSGQPINYTGQGTNTYFGKDGNGSANYAFGGALDEVRVENVARSSAWTRLSYENQRQDSITSQIMTSVALSPVFNGTLSNIPGVLNSGSPTMKINHQGDNPFYDTLSHAIMRFDLRQAAKLQRQGSALQAVSLSLYADSLNTPLLEDSAYFGIFSNNKLLPCARQDGSKRWTEDAMPDGSALVVGDSLYLHGFSGEPDSDGTMAWMVYNLQSEIKRLGFVQVDSMKWIMGGGAGDFGCYAKISGSAQAPSENAWESDSSGITIIGQISTYSDSQYTKVKIASAQLNASTWLWLGTNGMPSQAAWINPVIYGKRYKNAQLQVFQVQDSGIDTAGLSFTDRGPDLVWRHEAFEQESPSVNGYATVGIGTEDLEPVVPGHSPFWSRYKGKYRSRSPVVSSIITVPTNSGNDSTAYYFGVTSYSRVLPLVQANGYYPFRENLRADSNALWMNDSIFSTGIGGSAADTGNFAYLVYDLRGEAQRLNFGPVCAIRGSIGYCDGSDSVEVYVQTCTTTVQPSQSNWLAGGGGVKKRALFTSWSGMHDVSVNLITDSCGGPASNIKWVWLAVFSTKSKTGATSFGAFSNLSLVTTSKINLQVSLQSKLLSQAVQKAISDTMSPFVTLLGVCKDSGTSFRLGAMASPYSKLRPQLNLTFSSGRTLLSWQGRDSTLVMPSADTMHLIGEPSIGFGRYGKVVRFNSSAQYGQLVDSNHINYSKGSISFRYQYDGAGSGNQAVFFQRIGAGNMQFELRNDEDNPQFDFFFGDPSNGNMASFPYANESARQTFADLFDGNQHFFNFTWNSSAQSASLTIDGRSLAAGQTLSSWPNPSSWASAELRIGQNIDGSMENLTICSQATVPAPIAVTQTHIDSTGSWLPAIQAGFNDTVDCIVIAPYDSMGLFREECDKYALRNMSLGISTEVVNLNQITQMYSGSDIQDRLRNFLKYAYLQWHSKYLVLAGSTNLIPARKVAFQSQSGQQVTTDRYYACLEGSWNDNGNQYFGEAADSLDVTSELIVGRFPAETWNQLRTMMDRSNMGFGLPPYRAQCLDNADTVMLTGIKMFGNIGTISDGQFFCNGLQGILQGGAYTGGLQFKSYYPNDDPTNLVTDSISERWNKFMSKLNGFPGLWIHFGHGETGNIIIDRGASIVDWVELDENELETYPLFNRFQRMGHVRVVGCEAASQDFNSAGRTFLLKPYGGALTYIGTSEISYPTIESQLLQNECANMADSSIFTWGDIFRKSADDFLLNSSSWDIGKWVVFSRNFFGDPLLPVRTVPIGYTDTMKIKVTGTIVNGNNSITVKVTHNNVYPVEGALVGLVPKQVSQVNTNGWVPWPVSKTFADVTFSRCITNKNGVGTLSFNLIPGDSVLCITASHPDYLPTRVAAKVNGAVLSGTLCNLNQAYDLDTMYYHDGMLRAGDDAEFIYNVSNGQVLDDSVEVAFDTAGTKISVETNGIDLGPVSNSSGYPIGDSTGSNYMLYMVFSVDSCPPGASTLGYTIYFFKNGTKFDSVYESVPVIGAKVVPVISYIQDNSGNYTPQAGDNIRMGILLGNRYAASASGVQCKLISNSSSVTINPENDTTATYDYIAADSSAFDSNIVYQVNGGYSEINSGIIPAQIIVTAESMYPDTINICLNPMHDVSLHIDTTAVSVDYRGGVTLQWNDLKIDSLNNRHSNFLGYIVMRKTRGDATDNYTLLTPTAITAANYYYDLLPQNAVDSFTYRVAVVDSSFNCSAEDTINVLRPLTVKPGFPVLTSELMQAPTIANYDKGLQGQIYTAFNDIVTNGAVVGFRADGSKAVPYAETNGSFCDSTAAQIAFADLTGSGCDDAIFVTSGYVVAWDIHNDSLLWRSPIADAPHFGSPNCWRKPVIADINGDGKPEIIVFTSDNSSDWSNNLSGVSTLDVFSSTGIRLSRNLFNAHSYPPAICVGSFVPGKPGLQIALIAYNYFQSPDVSNDSAVSLHWQQKLWLLGPLSDTANVNGFSALPLIDATDISTVHSGWGRIPYGSMSAGEFDGNGSTEIALCTGAWGSGSVPGGPTITSGGQDSLLIYKIDNGTGAFSEVASYKIAYKSSDIFASGPAIADIDGHPDIVLATDDSIYVLNFDGTTITPVVPTIPFGRFSSTRTSNSDPTPQALVANINGENVILANHTDGSIWAFNIDNSGGSYHTTLRAGFPLQAQGTISQACAISALQGNGMLDLVAADDAGYIYDWTLGRGSIYNQPWPAAYGNNWNTGYNGYKDGGVVGFLNEDWQSPKLYPGSNCNPFSWIESDPHNACDTAGKTGLTYFDEGSGVVTTSSSGSRNLTYCGPDTHNWQNYTVTGSIKFDDTNAQFGFDVYSSMPDSCRKYSVIRRPDGKIEWRFYNGPQSDSILDISDDVLAPNAGTWYNFKIQINNSQHKIQAECWQQGVPDPTLDPDYIWSIQDNDASLSSGRVGLVSGSGSGNVYWGPVTVASNSTVGGIMANETFKPDTFVDVKPYTPVDWHPNYGSVAFATGNDTTGFVLDKTDTSLIYRPKAGVTYPVSCSVIPYTSLPWQDYTFSGKIVKPANPVYDSIGVGVDVYSANGKQYRVTFNKLSMTISGGGFHDAVKTYSPLPAFSQGYPLYFSITVSTDSLGGIADGSVSLTVNLSSDGQIWSQKYQEADQTSSLIPAGVPSFFVDLTGHENSALSAIRIQNAIVQKNGM